jgi:hypothetical protein
VIPLYFCDVGKISVWFVVPPELRERLTTAEGEHSELSAKRQQYLAVLKQRDSLISIARLSNRDREADTN